MAVRAGALEGAFVRPTDVNLSGLIATTVWKSRCLAAVPSRRHLADAESVALSALKGASSCGRPRPIGARLVDRIVSACEGTGFSPIIAQQDAPQMTSILSLGITFVPTSMGSFYTDFVVYKRISDDILPPALLSFIRSTNAGSPTLAHFEAVVEQEATATLPAPI